MSDNWSTNQRRYQEWLALPKYDRFPPTQDLLAREMGVNPATLTRWKKEDGFQAAVNEIAQQHLGAAVPEVMGALRREAEKGSFQHIKLFLEILGLHVEKQETSGELRIRVERDSDDYDTFANVARRTSRSSDDGEAV
jgi:hypothetical protein